MFIRKSYDINEEALEGMPANIQDFSLKHYSLYHYLHRVLRPIWDVKLAYKLPNSADNLYKPTFISLEAPKRKLLELLDFIDNNDNILTGEIYQPNIKAGEKYVNNAAILNVIQPVHSMRNYDKSRLEIMEKNSLKNLRFFITRSI